MQRVNAIEPSCQLWYKMVKRFFGFTCINNNIVVVGLHFYIANDVIMNTQ
jgi:hypothetical protein